MSLKMRRSICEEELKGLLEDRNGEIVYTVKLEKGENKEEVEAEMNDVAQRLNCDLTVMGIQVEKSGTSMHFSLRRKDAPIEIRMSVCGNVDAGKSTLVGVLSSGQLDNGRGSGRVHCLSHKHELETGRTSTIAEQLLGFDKHGTCVNSSQQRQMAWSEIVEKSTKLVSFNDMAGHEKYLKTTVTGLTGNAPDYSLILIGANMGVTTMTKEHFGLSLALKIPLIVVITKVDLCPENVKKQTMDEVNKLLKMKGVRKMSVMIRTENDMIACVKSLNERIVPIFEVSSVTGQGLDLLKKFLNVLPPRINWSKMLSLPSEISVETNYYVTGVGTVVGGLVISGTVHEGQTLLLGPDFSGNFKPVVIKSIHSKKTPVKSVHAGQSAGFALKKVKRNEIRHGTVLIDSTIPRQVTWTFQADIAVLSNHTTTIQRNYQPIIQCLGTRQSAKVIEIDKMERLRNGDRASVTFKYLYHPEFLKVGMRMIFREGHCKGIGVVTAIGDKTQQVAAH